MRMSEPPSPAAGKWRPKPPSAIRTDDGSGGQSAAQPANRTPHAKYIYLL